MQLNVEGLSAAKRHIIQSLAEIHYIDVICLQETHVNDDMSDHLTISGFDIISYTLHAKHGCATYVRSDVSDAAHVSSSPCCDVIRVGGYHIANIYKPPAEHWNNTNLSPVLPHPAVLVEDFNSHHPDWGYLEAELNGESLQEWALNNDYLLLDNAKQRGTFHSARWQCDYSPDLCWISMTVGHSTAHSLPPLWFLVISPTVSTDLQLFISASNIPIIRGVQRRRWNFRKADWASYTFATERSIPLIPVNNISVEESYHHFCGAMQKAARHSIP